MDKIKSNIFLIVISIVTIIIFLLTNTFEDSEPDIKINSYDAVVTIDDEGNMFVEETWDMEYSSGYTVRFRDIDYNKYPDNYPFPRTEDNIAIFDSNEASVQIIKNNNDITSNIDIGYSFESDYDELGNLVSCEPFRWECESIFTEFNFLYPLRDNVTFVYRYEIKGAVTEYSDVSELNWTLLEYAEASIEEGSITILLPNNTNNISDYTLFSHQILETETEIVSNNEMMINFTNMQSRDVVAFRLLMPSNLFPNIDDNNKVIHDEVNKQKILDYEDQVLANIDRGYEIEDMYNFIPFIVLGLMIGITFLMHRFVYSNKGVIVDEYISSPPTNLSPAQVGYLLEKKKIGKEISTATLLDLIRKGFVSINTDGFNENPEEVVFMIEPEKDHSNLKEHETRLLTWLFSKNTTSTTEINAVANDSLGYKKFLNQFRSFTHACNIEGIKCGFFDAKLENKKLFGAIFLLIPIVLLVSGIALESMYKITVPFAYYVSIPVIIAYFLFTISRTRYSEEGYETLLKWKKYRDYLQDTNNYQQSKMSDIEYWEEALVYATVFGIAEQVMEQLTIDIKDSSTSKSRFYHHNSMYYHRNHHSMMYYANRSMRNSISTAQRQYAKAHSSSSGGRSGGSSGGGGGGGRSR